MPRKPIPTMAWILSGATGFALTVLALILLAREGQHAFFEAGDSKFFLLTTRDVFGTGRGFAALGSLNEVPYRYGRIGLPLLAWLLAFGRPALVGWTLIVVNIAALSAIPGLAAWLLAEHRAPPGAAVLVLVLPAYLFLYGTVVSDPLVIALLLIAFIADARSRPRSALVVLACAILVKEIALFALMPLLWRAIRNRDRIGIAAIAAAVMPYAAWCVWVRGRIGTFPFLAHTESRTRAIGLPFSGIRETVAHFPYLGAVILAVFAATVLLGAAGAWIGRPNQIAGLAAVYTLLALCLGPQALRFIGEALRVMLVPQVFGLLALVIGLAARRRSAAAVLEPVPSQPARRPA